MVFPLEVSEEDGIILGAAGGWKATFKRRVI